MENKGFALDGHITAHTAGGQAPRYVGFRDRDFDAAPPAHPGASSEGPARSRSFCRIALASRATCSIRSLSADTGPSRRPGRNGGKGEPPSSTGGHRGVDTTCRKGNRTVPSNALGIGRHQTGESLARGVHDLDRRERLPSGRPYRRLLPWKSQAIGGQVWHQGRPGIGSTLGKEVRRVLRPVCRRHVLDRKRFPDLVPRKELAKAMARLRSNWISLSNYFSWAVNELDENAHLDLVELKNKKIGG